MQDFLKFGCCRVGACALDSKLLLKEVIYGII